VLHPWTKRFLSSIQLLLQIITASKREYKWKSIIKYRWKSIIKYRWKSIIKYRWKIIREIEGISVFGVEDVEHDNVYRSGEGGWPIVLSNESVKLVSLITSFYVQQSLIIKKY